MKFTIRAATVLLATLPATLTAQTYEAVINNGSVAARFSFSPSPETPGSTQVVYEVTGGLTNTSFAYTFHIHLNYLVKPDCLSAGPHLNPSNAPFGQPSYPTVSTESNWNLFEVGDLSGAFDMFEYDIILHLLLYPLYP